VVSTATGFTPHELAYGVKYTSEMDRIIMKEVRKRRNVLDTVMENQNRMNNHNKSRTDRKAVKVEFQVGDKVLIRNEKKHLTDNDRRYLGPYQVVLKRKDAVSYVLWNKHNNRSYIRNVSALRKYHKEGTQHNKAINAFIKKGPDTLPVAGDVVSIGTKVRVYWPDNEEWFYGTVVDNHTMSGDGTHHIKYLPDRFGDNDEPVIENLSADPRKGEVAVWEKISEFPTVSTGRLVAQ